MTGWTDPGDPEVLRSWRRGPRWWHVVVAVVDDPRVSRRRARLADLLGDLIGPSAPDHPHVTAWVSGSHPPVAVPEGERVAMAIGGADLFPSAAYLRVVSPGLLEARERLAAGNPAEDREVPFTPHLTVGLFRQRVPVESVRSAVAPMSDLPPLSVTGTIRHMVVDALSQDGALRAPPAG